jgi:dTDP-4-dehydrorhamnose 3,5-epimerase
VFRSNRAEDRRGFVQATYDADFFRHCEIVHAFVVENRCVSPRRGAMRGFHYQAPPFTQQKLIRVSKGRILDVNVDLRKGSPTFGRHTRMELAPDGWHSTYVPGGFAHCYCTLEDDTEVIFKLGAPFAPDHARGLVWNDPALAVEWPIAASEAIVLDRDLNWPPFSDLTEFFSYGGG